jgi:hypothetical protein
LDTATEEKMPCDNGKTDGVTFTKQGTTKNAGQHQKQGRGRKIFFVFLIIFGFIYVLILLLYYCCTGGML